MPRRRRWEQRRLNCGAGWRVDWSGEKTGAEEVATWSREADDAMSSPSPLEKQREQQNRRLCLCGCRVEEARRGSEEHLLENSARTDVAKAWLFGQEMDGPLSQCHCEIPTNSEP
jgi:hypothetical protein